MSMSATTAGILLFVFVQKNSPQYELAETIVRYLNRPDDQSPPRRVSSEVLQLYAVKPTRPAVINLCNALSESHALRHVDLIHRLKPNNGLRDLTATWRLSDTLRERFKLLVGIETVHPDFRHKYPIPNLTLQAGSIENGETLKHAAIRETAEEGRIFVHRRALVHKPIGLLSGGMCMFPCYIMSSSQLHFRHGNVYVDYAESELPAVAPPQLQPPAENDETQPKRLR